MISAKIFTEDITGKVVSTEPNLIIKNTENNFDKSFRHIVLGLSASGITKIWHIDNYMKPLRGISAYTIKELHDICNKINIKIVDTTGKNKTKKKLYENISENI